MMINGKLPPTLVLKITTLCLGLPISSTADLSGNPSVKLKEFLPTS